MSCGKGARLLVAAVLGLAIHWQALAEVVVIERAQATMDSHGADARAKDVALPYSWDNEHGAGEGEVRFVMDLPLADPAAPTALYVARMGNSYRVAVNGVKVAQFGRLPSDRDVDAVQQPRFFDVPQGVLRSSNVLEVTIGASSARGAGLSPIVAGPRDEVWQRYAATRLWQVSGSRVVAIVSAVLGLLAVLLWLRRRDDLFLFYGLGEIFWSVQTARVLFDQTPLPWPWWGVVVTSAFHAAPPLLCKFALTVIGRGQGVLARGMNLLLWLAVPAAVLWLVYGQLWLGPAMRAAVTVAAFAMAVVVVRATWRSKVLEERVLCVAVTLIVACGIRDVVMLRVSQHAYEVVPWSRFAWLGFGVSMAWLIAERMRNDSLALGAMNARLAQDLAARNAELAAAFERERENERKSGALEERQRLVRDLHDGLGSHLVSTLRMAQQDGASAQAIAGELREAVDQLRVTVDSMHDTEGDIASALAAVRYRLGPRLASAGIELVWDVHELPRAAGWGVREGHHLQMLLYEAFSNMLSHSGATSARLSARTAAHAGAPAVRIELQDDGRGFDSAAAGSGGGKGLANMRHRARALGGDLDIVSAPGRTQLSLVLPLRPQAS